MNLAKRERFGKHKQTQNFDNSVLQHFHLHFARFAFVPDFSICHFVDRVFAPFGLPLTGYLERFSQKIA